jgi:type III restriction enzyme
VAAAPIVPSRQGERTALGQLVDEFIKGLGDQAEEILSGYMDRAAGGFIQILNTEHRQFVRHPQYEHVTELRAFGPLRSGRPVTSTDRTGAFKKGIGYEGWTDRAMYEEAWFDSSTERDLANLLDDTDGIEFWVRLHVRDIEIRWDGGNYNPDFLAAEKDGTHWLIEVKSDKDAGTTDVKAKRTAAQRWANHVSSDQKVAPTRWNYLFVAEADIKQAKGDWTALKRGGGF